VTFKLTQQDHPNVSNNGIAVLNSVGQYVSDAMCQLLHLTI